MAVKNLLGNNHIGTGIKRRTLGKQKKHISLHQRIQTKRSQTDSDIARLSLPDFGLIPQMPFYSSYDLAKITKQNVWFNYASAEEILELYKLSMLKTGKCLNNFTNESLLRFIENSLNVNDEELDGYPEFLDVLETKNYLVFDTDKNRIDYVHSAYIASNVYEDVTSMWYQQTSRSQKVNQFLREYQVLMSLISPVDHVYLLDFEKYLKELDIDDIENYLNEDQRFNEEDAESNIKAIRKCVKHIKTDEYKHKQADFNSLCMMDECSLFDRVIEKVRSGKYKLPCDKEVLAESLTYVMNNKHKHLETLMASGYSSDLSPFSRHIITDGSSMGANLCLWYITLVDIDMENMVTRDINMDYSLLDEPENTFRIYTNHLRTVL